MDILKQSAIAFSRLFSYEYILVAGSKQTLIHLTLSFHKDRFMHLVGLHKLTDLQLQRYKSSTLFDMIMSDKLTYSQISKSTFFPAIKQRIHLLPVLEEALNSNEIMIKYQRSHARSTVIQAEYLIIYDYNGTTIHYFIDKDNETGKYEGKSFFAHNDNKYIAKQQTFKVLKKYKHNLENDTVEVLLDKKLKST